MDSSEFDSSPDPRPEPARKTGRPGAEERDIHRLDAALRVPLFVKILFGNAFVALVAGVAALYLAGFVSGRTSQNAVLGLAVFAVAVLALATVLNIFVVRTALSPLDHLAETAERVRRGNLSARVRLSRLADHRMRALVVLFNRMLDTLQAGRRRQRELARQILDSEENERERIAHELYAGPAQTLAAVMIRLRLAARGRACARGGEEACLEDELRDDVAAALEEIRSLARRLRPPELGEIGVRAALEAHARTLTENRDIRVAFEGAMPDPELDAHTATVFFRIVEEAITNAVLHSRGRVVEVEFSTGHGRIAAEVRDDGRGFDALEQLRKPHNGLGIAGMQERASYVGGRVLVASRKEGGTRVQVELPWRSTQWADGRVTAVEAVDEIGLPGGTTVPPEAYV